MTKQKKLILFGEGLYTEIAYQYFTDDSQYEVVSFTKDDKYIINEDIFDKIFDDVRNQLYQSTMSQLASKGYIECAWDDEEDKMIFWIDKAKK